MKTPQDYLTDEDGFRKTENVGKDYLVLLNDGSKVVARIDESYEENYVINNGFFTGGYQDSRYLPIEEIKEVIQELPEDFSNDCYNCFDGVVDVEKAFIGETICFDCKEKEVRLEVFKTDQDNVYKYDNLHQLQKLFDTLEHPIADNFEIDWKTKEINKKGLKDFGLMYCWSNMGDLDDYPLDYCAIIQGVKI